MTDPRMPDSVPTPIVSEPVPAETPNGATMLTGDNGLACVQDFLAHIFGATFDSWRQLWQLDQEEKSTH